MGSSPITLVIFFPPKSKIMPNFEKFMDYKTQIKPTIRFLKNTLKDRKAWKRTDPFFKIRSPISTRDTIFQTTNNQFISNFDPLQINIHRQTPSRYRGFFYQNPTLRRNHRALSTKFTNFNFFIYRNFLSKQVRSSFVLTRLPKDFLKNRPHTIKLPDYRSGNRGYIGLRKKLKKPKRTLTKTPTRFEGTTFLTYHAFKKTNLRLNLKVPSIVSQKLRFYKTFASTNPLKSTTQSFFQKPLGSFRVYQLLKTKRIFYNQWLLSRQDLGCESFQGFLHKKSFFQKQKSFKHQVHSWLADLYTARINSHPKMPDFLKKNLLDNPPYILLDECLLHLNLQKFHESTTHNNPYVRLFEDRISFWEEVEPVTPDALNDDSLDNFEEPYSSEESEPFIMPIDPVSFRRFFYKNDTQSWSLLRRFFKKTSFMSSFGTYLKNKQVFKLPVNYPFTKEKHHHRPILFSRNLIYTPIAETNQLKIKYNKELLEKLNTNPTLKIQVLLVLSTNVNFSNKVGLFAVYTPLPSLYQMLLWKALFQYISTSGYGKFHLFNTIGSHLNPFIKNSRISNPNNFFNSMRFLTRQRINYQPKQGIPLRVNKPFSLLPTTTMSTTKPLNSMFSRYYNYITFLNNLNQNPIKRPLYSTFFTIKQFLTTTSFYVSINEKSTSLKKSPISSNNPYSNVTKYSLVYTLFKSQYSDNVIETTYDNSLVDTLTLKYKNPFLGSLKGSFQDVLTTSTKIPNHFSFVDSPKVPNNLFSDTLFNKKWNFFRPSLFLLQSAQLINFNESYYNPLFKYLFWSYDLLKLKTTPLQDLLWLHNPLFSKSSTFFSSKIDYLKSSNVLPLPLFSYILRRKVIKTLANDLYIPRTTVYFYRTLIHFIEFFSGRKVFLKFNPFVENTLSFKDVCQCSLWYNKINTFQKILGHRIFVHESLRIFMVAVRFRDPLFLANWIKAMLYRMSFWKYRTLFRYIKYVFRALFYTYFEELDFKGVRLVVRGKISVAGNARARTLAFAVGNTSHSEMNNRVLSHFTTIDSFTGVMGFRLSFYF